MGAIDLRTIFLNFIFTDFITLVFLIMLWFQNRNRYAGLELIAIGFVFNFLCIVLIFLRGNIPDLFSIVVSNTFGIISSFFNLLGLARFVGYKPNKSFNYIIIFVFILIHTYFTFVNPNLSVRSLNNAVGFLIFGLQTVWVLFQKTPQKLRQLTRNTGFIFIVFCLINIARIINFVVNGHNHTNDYFHTGYFETGISLSYQLTLLVMGFLIVLMINKRLTTDISQEERKLSIVYHSVPYAIIITRKNDGFVLDANEGMMRILGYKREEVLGKTTLELNIWEQIQDREKLISELFQKNKSGELEFRFRKKSGELVDGQISSTSVVVDDEDCILSVINDITYKKKAEKEIKNSREVLKKIVLNLQTEQEKEKITVASLIDNELNQSLAALRINIGILKKKLKPNGNNMSDDVMKLVDDTYQQSGMTIERSLTMMNRMRNEVLYLLGFVEAVNYSIEEIEKNFGIKCILRNKTHKIDLEPNKSATLFIVFQQLLHYILQQNKADIIEININQSDKILFITVSDNGNIFQQVVFPDENSTLAEIKEKVGLFNGTLSIIKNGDSASAILIEMPLSDCIQNFG